MLMYYGHSNASAGARALAQSRALLGAVSLRPFTPHNSARSQLCCDASGQAAGSEDAGEESGDASSASGVHGIGGLVTAAFAFGQVVGPLLGTNLTSWLGFEPACAVMVAFLSCVVVAIVWLSRAELHQQRWPTPLQKSAQKGISLEAGQRTAPFATSSRVATTANDES